MVVSKPSLIAPMLVGNENVIPVTEALLAFTVFCFTFFIIKSFQRQTPRGLKRLPGPRGYPLIGNVLDLGKNPHLSLTRMSQKYGDVMKIHIGTRPVVVLSGLETLRQALVKQGEAFMGRPDLYSFRQISDGQSLAFGREPGEIWRARKSLVLRALRSFSAAPSLASCSTSLLEEHISKEAECLVAKLLQVMEEGKSFDPIRYMVISVVNVTCALSFGSRYSHEDQELLTIVNMTHETEELFGAGSPADFIPVLQYLPNPTMKKFKELDKLFLAFLQKHINEHYENFCKDNIRDITDSLIMQSQEQKIVTNRGSRVHLPEEKIVNLVNDLVGASFDTVTTALSWSLMYLVAYPEIQKKIQAELDQTVGGERNPRLSDRPMLPYTEAFILEVFRHSSYFPFTIPHCTTQDTVLNGFWIPKDTCVFINQWQVNHNEKLWKDPSSFSPERFLTAEGTGIDRAKSEKVLVFGLGKRRCIGESIARQEVFLFLASLLHALEFSICDGKPVDLTPCYGLVMKHKRCDRFQVKQRIQKRLGSTHDMPTMCMSSLPGARLLCLTK
uniref:Cytochrome P450 1A n=1 Tax=Varanus komodoensis TaxID=61221 RepID=A0A8D2J176_VARKO